VVVVGELDAGGGEADAAGVQGGAGVAHAGVEDDAEVDELEALLAGGGVGLDVLEAGEGAVEGAAQVLALGLFGEQGEGEGGGARRRGRGVVAESQRCRGQRG
jgi:hypothetical protein